MACIESIDKAINEPQSKDNRSIATHGHTGIPLFDAVQRCSRYTRTLRQSRR